VRALRARSAAFGFGADVAGLAGTRSLPDALPISLAGRGIAARSAGALEAVVVAGAGAVAGVLVDALGARIAAVDPRGDVVGLAGARAVAGVGCGPLRGSWVVAGRARSIEPVVVAG